jgi:hypothetical protein
MRGRLVARVDAFRRVVLCCLRAAINAPLVVVRSKSRMRFGSREVTRIRAVLEVPPPVNIRSFR